MITQYLHTPHVDIGMSEHYVTLIVAAQNLSAYACTRKAAADVRRLHRKLERLKHDPAHYVEARK